MKAKLKFIAIIFFSALLHVSPMIIIGLLATATIPLTEANVALIMLGLVVNALALVQLHIWNAEPMK